MRVIHCTLLLLNEILISLQGDFILLVPEQPFVAITGEDVVLDCELLPSTSASNMAVWWLKSDLSSPIHVYRHGQGDPLAQHQDYRGRTDLFKDEITEGNISLRLKNVRPDDEGRYTCSVKDRIDFKQATVELRVHSSGSEPRIQMKRNHGAGIQLVCKSSGWNPEPEIQWIGGDGNALTEAETKYHRDSGLVNVESSVRVTRQSSGKLKCIIRSQHLKTEHTAIITISDDLFPAVPEWVLPLVVTICVVIAANFTLIYWNVKQNRCIKELELQKFFIESGKWKPLEQSVSVTLDVETASPRLQVSEDRKSVRLTGTRRNLPDTGKRFTDRACVLGSEGFTSGRHYWEVEVTGNRYWSLGVAAESVQRKRWVRLSPGTGFWIIERDDNWMWVHTSLGSRLPAGPIPGRVGVYLSYESGTVSFYNAETKFHLHTYSGNKFTGKLYPFLETWRENHWLRICPGLAPGL
ncbi:butyrophilin subfamily 1 member A1-like isoform X2 [Mobula hypostoma]|uniref:butyrophilin subfamily 1 member A1-like isoform X2 n=1 Tax=Mobula hypostoma TaxID=723540 RepID=UPI002FC3DC34